MKRQHLFVAALYIGLGAMQAMPCFAQEVRPNAVALTRPLRIDDPGLDSIVAGIAERLLDLEGPSSPAKELDNRVRLELASRRFAEGFKSATALDEIAAKQAGSQSVGRLAYRRWSLYAQAETANAERSGTFEAFYGEQVRRELQSLDSRDAYALEYSFDTPLTVLESNLTAILHRDSGAVELDVEDAVALVRAYETLKAYRRFQPLADIVAADDNSRRYIVDRDVPIPSPDGATICMLIVRPRADKPLPSLLNFTIYDDPIIKLDDARRTAANGYPAVIAFTRGKGCSPQKPIPMIHDGADADTVIEWIARQPWSDGRVGMFGGSYEGFTQWAAAKHPPSALKAIMPSVSFSPGIDFPMDGGIFLNYGFAWPLYTTDNKLLDDALYFDERRWNHMQMDWYKSGEAYKELGTFAKAQNPIWDSWLAHPTYDHFWRDLKPSDAELNKLGIAVLVTTGYYDSGQSGALSYWSRYVRSNPHGETYLVIGPWDHHTAQLGTVSPMGTPGSSLFRGLQLDAAAQFDIIALRYQWFDWIFGRSPKPAILQNRVNYEVMGEDCWRHSSSLEGMGTPHRFYLTDTKEPHGTLLSDHPEPTHNTVQRVDFRDRSDSKLFAPSGPLIDQALDDWPIVTNELDLANSTVYETKPLTTDAEVSGLFSASVDTTVNKRDLDLAVTLFQITPSGEWIQLSYDWQRASYARDPSKRILLSPGQKTRITLTARRATSRLLNKGDRLAVVVGVIKQPGEEINYGSGNPVSDETVDDAIEPLIVRWWGDSWIEVPLRTLSSR